MTEMMCLWASEPTASSFRGFCIRISYQAHQAPTVSGRNNYAEEYKRVISHNDLYLNSAIDFIFLRGLLPTFNFIPCEQYALSSSDRWGRLVKVLEHSLDHSERFEDTKNDVVYQYPRGNNTVTRTVKRSKHQTSF